MLYPYPMDFKKRFQEIAEFLQPYQRIWQNEIMLLYPNPLNDFPQDWVNELAQFKNQEDVIRLEKKRRLFLYQVPFTDCFLQAH